MTEHVHHRVERFKSAKCLEAQDKDYLEVSGTVPLTHQTTSSDMEWNATEHSQAQKNSYAHNLMPARHIYMLAGKTLPKMVQQQP